LLKHPSIIESDPLLLTDLLTAFTLLTRLPVARFGRLAAPPHLARCVWAFPLVGLVVNAFGGLAYWLMFRIGVPPVLASIWTLAVTMIVTGAFHEDGLADAVDGMGGGTNPARKMEIMHDSRIGSYGALALLISVIVRVAAIEALGRPAFVMTAMILAGMLGRSGILVIILSLGPARSDGMGASMGKPRAMSAAAGISVATAASLLYMPILPAIAAVLLGLGSALAVAKLAHAQIGGHTGDVLGAGEVLTECVVLTVIASSVGI
jgi:adenosylcobinamide-GDP ribazoletransferase